METQMENAGISQFSRMNAFYGNPNISQATSAAIDRGAQPPEVYTREAQEASEALEASEPQVTETETEPTQEIPLEAPFSQTTEQLEISDQAVAMQQSEEGALVAQAAQAYGAFEETGAREDAIAAQLQTAEEPQNIMPEVEQPSEPNQPTSENPRETPASALNESVAPEPLATGANNQAPSGNTFQQSYGQFAGLPTANSAVQTGSTFSALG